MRNTKSQQRNEGTWLELIREAKLRLLDEEDADERRMWRRAVKSFELLRRKKVEIPRAA